MHMADALVSAPVAVSAAVVAAALTVVAAGKIKKCTRDDIIPLMGMMGAFVFAAQMINFAIPGTGSSGHIIGGVLLAAILGPWAAFITLVSVIIVQCLLFADGGLLVLGCNIINMAVTSTLIAYPLIYRPIARNSLSAPRLFTAAIAASVIALQIGAVAVTFETEISGITALPTSVFLRFMLPIHLAIGAIEGIATGAVLVFIAKYRPETLFETPSGQANRKGHKLKSLLLCIAAATLVFAIGFVWIASANPDGLEWSIEKTAGGVEFASSGIPTALMPDYNTNFAGIIGATFVMLMLWIVSSLLLGRLTKSKRKVHN